jgi:hypothetical protein
MLYFEHKRLHSTLVTSVRRTRHKNRTLPSGLRSSRVWRRAFGVKSEKSFFLDYLTSYLDGFIVKVQAILARPFETPRTTHTITQPHNLQDLRHAAVRTVIRLRFTTEARVQFRPHNICCGPSGTCKWFSSGYLQFLLPSLSHLHCLKYFHGSEPNGFHLLPSDAH